MTQDRTVSLPSPRKPTLATTMAMLLVLLFGYSNSQAADSETLILIGIDGFRWDIIDRHPAPAMRALAADGVRARGVIPVFPAKTFPNFYAIATGLYPERNGVMDNATYDPVLDRTFVMSDGNDPAFFEGEPIWSVAEAQGVTSATMFWVGSEAPSDTGILPTYWHPFDGSVPPEQRAQQVLDWLDLEPADRPRFISVYFQAIDSASHEFGVGSVQEREAVAIVDRNVATIVEGVSARGLTDSVNFVLIGDHGMANYSRHRIIYLDQLAPLENVFSPQLSDDGRGNATFASFFGEDDDIEMLYEQLRHSHPALSVYRRGQYPDWLHQSHPVREPDMVAILATGWLLSKTGVELPDTYRAGHGFNSFDQEMHSAFIANGPAFQQGQLVDAFSIVQIFNLLAYALGIESTDNDGDLNAVRHLLRD